MTNKIRQFVNLTIDNFGITETISLVWELYNDEQITQTEYDEIITLIHTLKNNT